MARTAKTEITREAPAPKQNRALSAIIVLAVLLLVAVGIAGYFYYQYKYATPIQSQADDVASLTKILGEMMELPTGETPTLATVKDREKLADQPFFQKAENGDKVLIYTDSGRAILYRPSTGKIVDVTTVNVNTPPPTTTSDATAPQAPETAGVTAAMPASDAPDTGEKVAIQEISIALYNGSTKIGVTNTLEDEIKAKFPDVEIVAKEKAGKNDYQGTLVVDLSGGNADLAKSLADSFGGTIGTLPAGETAPENTDILIIVGNK